jgi:hypothetical protein
MTCCLRLSLPFKATELAKRGMPISAAGVRVLPCQRFLLGPVCAVPHSSEKRRVANDAL